MTREKLEQVLSCVGKGSGGGSGAGPSPTQYRPSVPSKFKDGPRGSDAGDQNGQVGPWGWGRAKAGLGHQRTSGAGEVCGWAQAWLTTAQATTKLERFSRARRGPSKASCTAQADRNL